LLKLCVRISAGSAASRSIPHYLWQQPHLITRLFRPVDLVRGSGDRAEGIPQPYDAGLISGTVFEHLNLTMNLNRDAVKGKEIPPTSLSHGSAIGSSFGSYSWTHFAGAAIGAAPEPEACR